MLLWPKHNRIIIVASGPSLKSISPDEIAATKATIIAVNGAIDWLPRADYWFSLDDSDANLRRCRVPKDGAIYVAAFRDETKTPHHVIRPRRLSRDHVPRYERLLPQNRGRHGLSDDPRAIHSGNSAYGALGLAWHMKPHIIGLLGVDGSQDERIEGGRPNDLRHLPALFESALPQLQSAGVTVINGSPESAVTCFRRTSPQEALRIVGRSC